MNGDTDVFKNYKAILEMISFIGYTYISMGSLTFQKFDDVSNKQKKT